MSLKHSLRSKEFITLLNNLGHCIGHGKVLRTDTDWAKALLEKDDSYTMFKKKKKAFGYFTQTAANNADYAQEIDSQHVKNAVLYQDDCF